MPSAPATERSRQDAVWCLEVKLPAILTLTLTLTLLTLTLTLWTRLTLLQKDFTQQQPEDAVATATRVSDVTTNSDVARRRRRLQELHTTSVVAGKPDSDTSSDNVSMRPEVRYTVATLFSTSVVDVVNVLYFSLLAGVHNLAKRTLVFSAVTL